MASRVRVNHAAIESMFLPGGQIYTHTDEVRRDAALHAKAYAPKRSGALARSISSDMRGTNRNQTRFRVYSNLPYARYVSQGTDTPIRPGTVMTLYAGPRFVPAQYVRTKNRRVLEVRGQDANDFLGKGLRRAMRKYGYL